MASQSDQMKQARLESLTPRPAIANSATAQGRPGGGRNEGLRMLAGAGRIKLDRIMPDPGQPRKTFATEADARLADSMTRQGQLVPALVRWDSAADRYVVIDGERRYRAALAAGLAELAVVVEDEADPDTILELQLITNALREEVAPVEQARAYQRLIEAQGLTRRQLAEKLAIDQSAVTKALDLLKLPAEVQSQVDAGHLAASTATQIARLDDPAEQVEVARQAVAEGMSRADVAARVDAARPRASDKPTSVKPKGKVKPATSRRFKRPGGLVIEVTQAKGIDLAKLAAELHAIAAEIEADSTPAE